MSTITSIKFEYRCGRCFHALYANCDEAGTESECKHCGHAQILPDASPERIARAEAVGAAAFEEPSAPTVNWNANWSDAEIEKQLKRDLQVPLSQMTTLSTIASGPLKRLGGVLIDGLLMVGGLLMGIFLLIVLMSLGLVSKRWLEPHARMTGMEAINVLGTIYFLPVAITIFQWNLIATQGQTVGKWLLRMKIVTRSGANPGFMRGVVLRNWLRNLLGLIPFFGLFDAVAIFCNEEHRCIHDYLAATYVVDV